MNARQAQLSEQRQRAKRLYFAGLGERRLSYSLMPANSAVSTIAMNYDQATDKAILAKWQTGEITDDEYLAHQEKILNRPYLSSEEKTIAIANLKILRNQIEDKKTYEAYKSGRLSRRQLLSYESNKLVNLTPGSQVYDLQLSTINELSKQIKADDRKNYRLTQETAITNLPGRETPGEYNKRAELYQQLADQAKTDGQIDEANEYLQKSYEYRDYSTQLQASLDEKQATLKEKTDKENLINQLNTWVDTYRNSRITPQEFMQGLDEMEKSSLSLQATDLLDAITDWRNSAREDLAKGNKPWSRGGTGGATGGGGGTTNSQTILNQGKLEDIEYEKAKKALIEQIPDKNNLIAAVAELTDRYLNGADPNEEDPDGWVGLVNRAAVLQNKIETTGKGSVAELNSMFKKVNAKSQDYSILQEATKNPDSFAVLYKKDGSVEIMDISGKVAIDPETGNEISYFKQNNVGNLGNGTFVEGEPLEIVNQEGKRVTGSYFGTLPGGKIYQWSPGKTAISQEEFLRRAEELKSQNKGNFNLVREIDNITNWAKSQFGKAKELITPKQPEMQATTETSNFPQPKTSVIQPFLGTKLYSSLLEKAKQVVSPAVSQVKEAVSQNVIQPQMAINKAVAEKVGQVVQPAVKKVQEVVAPQIQKAQEEFRPIVSKAAEITKPVAQVAEQVVQPTTSTIFKPGFNIAGISIPTLATTIKSAVQPVAQKATDLYQQAKKKVGGFISGLLGR